MTSTRFSAIKTLIFICCLAAFTGPALADGCNAPQPTCVILHAMQPEYIEVENNCDVSVALRTRTVNAYSGTIVLHPQGSKVRTAPLIPKNPALPAYFTTFDCCPDYGEGFGCPYKERRGFSGE